MASEYKAALEVHEEACEQEEAERDRAYAKQLADWKEARDAFLQVPKETNAQVDALKEGYELRDPDVVCEYCDLVFPDSTVDAKLRIVTPPQPVDPEMTFPRKDRRGKRDKQE